MSSTPSAPGKSLPAQAVPNHSQTPAQAPSPVAFDSGRRQNNQSQGQGGQGQGPAVSQAAPRKNQGARRQHRNQRRAGQSRDEDEEDMMAEIRAVRNASSRRGQTSITHLLNYSLPPRPYHDMHHGYSSSRSYRRNPTWGPGSGYHAVDKARYVHANYRFIVSPEGNYASQAADADEHLDWNDILQIIASAESQQTSCPICLSDPVAPRMAKCGHIFCLPCLIRFMNSSSGEEDAHGKPEKKQQNRWRKCPICEDTVYINEVRPVRFYAGQESPLPRPGEDVVLRLMMRHAKSTLALPKEGGAEVLESRDDIPWHFAANVLDYARIMKGTGDYMVEQFDGEIEELLRQEKEDELMFHQDNEWTQRAVKAVTAAKEKVVGLGEAELKVSFAQAQAAQTSGSGSQHPRHNELDFYFYTTPPHLYLSPLDIRILKTKFGSFSAFPSTLLPRVEHISTGHSVDDAMRKRAKYLGHLPRGCNISFLECDWTDIVPAETLEAFKDEIERRRKRNRDKVAQEERERLQAERIEAAALRSGGGRRHGSASADEDVSVRFGNSGLHFHSDTPVNMDDFVPLGAVAEDAEEGTTPPNPRTGFGHLSDVSTSPSGAKTVWGTRLVPGASPEMMPSRGPVDDGWLRDDVVLESLGATEIAEQMEAFRLQEAKDVAESSAAAAAAAAGARGAGGSGGKGKKKKQKITLMSTGGKRGI